MYIEGNDVLLTILSCDKIINVRRPLLNLRHTLDGIILLVVAGLEDNLLVTEGKLTHLPLRTAENEVRHRSETWLSQSLIFVLDATSSQVLSHHLWDGLALVDRCYLASLGNLEVQMLSAEVIVTLGNGYLPSPVAPVSLVFTAESGGASLTSPDVQYLLCYSFHIYDMLICVSKNSVPACCLGGHSPEDF